MSRKEISIEIYEPDKIPIKSNCHNLSNLNLSKDYVGLNNQGKQSLVIKGNTCYLNSLLQALFMTPEFRFKIFHWIYKADLHAIMSDCIPFQIKKLFARMQLKSRGSEETKDLTKSFQWEKMEVTVQHDIQELCRVLFDAIETSLSNEEENFINDLFEGESIHVVKCSECKNESVRSDKFLDLSLPIRNDFLKIFNKSLEMAFVNYLKPELLGLENQYKCEQCNKKVNADKYMQFTKLPKILFVQLNRFEFDYTSMDKKKIYDKVTYPEILNMNYFYHKEFSKINQFFSAEYLKSLNERKIQSDLHDEIKTALNEGPLVYELYAILSHSGTANSGHYKAYIKSFENGKWYCFDDSIVFEILKENYKHIFGGFIENEKASTETPYILLYNLITANNKITHLDKNLIDESLVKLIDEENNLRLVEEEKAREKAQNLILKFYVFDQIKSINAKKYDLVSNLKRVVIQEFGITKFKENNIRIRAINISISHMLEPLKEEWKTLEDVNISPNKNYTLEIKNDEEVFDNYDPYEIILSVIKWDNKFHSIEEREFSSCNLKINRYEKLIVLEERIYKLFQLQNDSEIMIYRKIDIGKNNFNITLINTKENRIDNKDMTECGLYDSLKLYLEIKDENWKESNFIRLFNEKTPIVTAHFNSPLETILNKTKVSMNSYRFNNEIEVKKNQSIKELKSMIGEVLKLPNKEFIMRKFTHNGQEIKASNDYVEKLGSNSINIFIELGMSLGEDEIKIKVILCEFELQKFSIFPYRLKEIGIFIINTLSTISEVKESICEELKIKYNVILDKEYVLIRDYLLEKPTKVFQNNQIVKSLKLSDLKKICIQEFKAEKIDLNSDQMLTTIRIWDPSSWILSPSREVVVPKKISCSELNTLLLKYLPDIMENKLSVFKIVNCNNLFLDDLEKLKFENLFTLNENFIDNTPLFLNSDGNLLILRDDSKLLREPTNDEIKLFCKPKGKYTIKTNVNNDELKIAENNKKSQFSKVGNKLRIKEQAIRIKVKKDDEKRNSGEMDYNSTLKSEEICEKDDSFFSNRSNMDKTFDDQNKIQSERLAKKQEKIEIIQIFSANFEEENQINQMDLLNKNK